MCREVAKEGLPNSYQRGVGEDRVKRKRMIKENSLHRKVKRKKKKPYQEERIVTANA